MVGNNDLAASVDEDSVGELSNSDVFCWMVNRMLLPIVLCGLVAIAGAYQYGAPLWAHIAVWTSANIAFMIFVFTFSVPESVSLKKAECTELIYGTNSDDLTLTEKVRGVIAIRPLHDGPVMMIPLMIEVLVAERLVGDLLAMHIMMYLLFTAWHASLFFFFFTTPTRKEVSS